jgi:hypothetical protein
MFVSAVKGQAMSNFIDSHTHVWTPDTLHYPLGKGWKKEEMGPASFTPEEFLKHAKPEGVSRANLIQMSYYGPKVITSGIANVFDNSYMLDMIAVHKGVFVACARRGRSWRQRRRGATRGRTLDNGQLCFGHGQGVVATRVEVRKLIHAIEHVCHELLQEHARHDSHFAAGPAAKITSTFRRTRSAARPGNASGLPPAPRTSKAIVWPST